MGLVTLFKRPNVKPLIEHNTSIRHKIKTLDFARVDIELLFKHFHFIRFLLPRLKSICLKVYAYLKYKLCKRLHRLSYISVLN